MKTTVLATAVAFLSTSAAFMPSNIHSTRSLSLPLSSTITEEFVELTSAGPPTVKKPTGTSFLPAETVERCKVGNPAEKAKIAKDGTSAWVDVYEYARKIREGEMTWEEVEKAELDTVRISFVSLLLINSPVPHRISSSD